MEEMLVEEEGDEGVVGEDAVDNANIETQISGESQIVLENSVQEHTDPVPQQLELPPNHFPMPSDMSTVKKAM
jgi:hypothetical protein